MWPFQQSKCRHSRESLQVEKQEIGNLDDNSQSLHCPLTCKTQWLRKPIRPRDLETTSTSSPAVSFEDENFYLWLLGKQLCVWGAQWTPAQESKSQPNPCPLPKAMSSIWVSIFKMRLSAHTSHDLSGQDEMMHVKPMASGQAKDSPINTPQILKTHSNHQNLIGKHRVSQFASRIEIDYMKHLIVSFLSHFTTFHGRIWGPTCSAW